MYKMLMIFGVFVLTLLLAYVWRRRRLYYIASKLDGPFALPFIGNLYLAPSDYKKLYKTLKTHIMPYPSLFKVWIGPYLFFVDSRPEDMEILLNNCLEKNIIYTFLHECFGDGLLTAPVDIWKRHRKLINPSFNIQVLKTFHEAFVNQENYLMADLNKFCGRRVDLFPKIFKCTVNLLCETLCGVDTSNLEGQEKYIENITSYLDMVIDRLCTPLFYVPFFWKLSSAYKKASPMIDGSFGFIKKLVAMKQFTFSTLETDDKIEKKIFLNKLIKLNKENLFTEKEIMDEIQIMLIGGSETTAVTLSYVLLAVGINFKVQENIFKELDSIFEESERDPTVDDLNKMDYLERVIKETMRLLPTAPFFARAVDKDVKLSDGTVLPSGSSFVVPVFKMNKDPEIWENPLEYDPDRFLPEKVKTRHPLSFIPFSHGPRNCIGFKYGMWSMKVFLAAFFRNYKIVSVDYKSIDEIDQVWSMVTAPKDGCHIIYERRI